MKKSILNIILILIANICIGQYSSIDTTYYPNGQIHLIIMKLEGDSITIQKRFYSQHLKFENGVFVLGEKKEDRIEAIETYIKWGNNGLMQEGYSEYFYENGQKRFEVIYSRRKGNRYINQWDKSSKQILKSGNGIYTQMDIGINGLDSLIYEVKDSLLHGKFVRYSKNEKGEFYIRAIQNFDNNNPVGIKRTYRPNSKLLLKEEYLNRPDSVLYEVFYENGNLEKSGIKLNDRRIGIWSYYSENGVKEKEIEYQENYYNGIYREFHSNGTLKEEGNYIVVMQESEVILLDPESFEEIKSVRKIETSVKEGKWIYKDERGKIVKEEYYKEGILKKKTSDNKG